MNTFVADPEWGGWIIWYFFLGGIAAGAYFLATLAELFGGEGDRKQTRAGYLIAAPLVAVCGVLLILDLGQPTRFWHMLFEHDSWRPHIKWWSPMSIGAWAVTLFGLMSTVSFVGVLTELKRIGLSRFAPLAARLHRGVFGRTFDIVGAASGFFVASYTGVLLTATNQPIWSDSPWIGALFLASSAGTGLAAIKLFSLWPERPASDSLNFGSLDKIERWGWILELIAAALFVSSFDVATLRKLVSLGLALPFVGALCLGVFVPAILHWQPRGSKRSTRTITAVCVLLGGFLLRYAVLAAPPAVLRQPKQTTQVGDLEMQSAKCKMQSAKCKSSGTSRGNS